MRTLDKAVHVLDDREFSGDRRQAGNRCDDDQRENHKLTIVLKLRAVAHVVAR